MADRPRRRALLERALARLQEALAKPEDSIVRDAAIQRFEFTFEMAWRAIQAFAQAEGVACSSHPLHGRRKDSLRAVALPVRLDDGPPAAHGSTMNPGRRRTCLSIRGRCARRRAAAV